MLNCSLQRWPNIETALGDCPVFAGVLPHSNAGDAFLPRRQKGHYPDNTIHRPNADVMMGHRYPNQIPLSSNHKCNREYYFFLTLFKRNCLT